MNPLDSRENRSSRPNRVCKRCSHPMASELDTCPQCGQMPGSNLDLARESLPTAEAGATLHDVIDNRLAVVLLLFLVTGVLGIPMLWMNRRFSVTAKVALSIATTVYTAALVWICWLAVQLAWNAITPLLLP